MIKNETNCHDINYTDIFKYFIFIFILIIEDTRKERNVLEFKRTINCVNNYSYAKYHWFG